jgi:hypothetical protein
MQNAGNRIIMLLEAVTLLLKVVFNEFFSTLFYRSQIFLIFR